MIGNLSRCFYEISKTVINENRYGFFTSRNVSLNKKIREMIVKTCNNLINLHQKHTFLTKIIALLEKND